MRTRLALALLTVALPLAACSGDDAAPDALPDVSSSVEAPAPSSAPPSAAPPSAPASSRATSSPRASSVSASSGATTVYGRIRKAEPESFVYDQVDYVEARCNAVEGDDNLRYDKKDAACFRNVNPRLRTVRIADDATLEVQNEGDPLNVYQGEDLVNVVDDPDAVDTPPQYRVWEITLRGGLAVKIASFQVAGA